MPKVLPWFAGALALALVMILTVGLVKPIGASTEFVVADAIIWDWFDDTIVQPSDTSKSGYESSNAYINEGGGKIAKSAAQPLKTYSVVFVLFIMVGAFLSSRLGGDKPVGGETEMPAVWRARFGDCKITRYLASFIGGFLVLFGARLAGGCTSGHMLSGIMQTSISGYLFLIGLLGVSIPLAILMYPKHKKHNGKGE